MSRVGTRDVSGDLPLTWSHDLRSPDGLARAPCFSGSRADLVTGFTCGTLDLELVKLDVADCVHDRNWFSSPNQEMLGMFGKFIEVHTRASTLQGYTAKR